MGTVILWLVCITVLIIVISIIINITKIVQLNREIYAEFVILEDYMKKRWDLIPSLIENVRKCPQYSKDILEDIILARNTTYRIMSTEKKLHVDNVLSFNIDKLFKSVVQEDEKIYKLQEEFIKLENLVEDFKLNYNEKVKIYNSKIERFPFNLIVYLFKYRKKDTL